MATEDHKNSSNFKICCSYAAHPKQIYVITLSSNHFDSIVDNRNAISEASDLSVIKIN